MDPVSITLTAVGWLMSSLVEKAVTALLEAWAKHTGLGNDFKTLKNQLQELRSARGLPTDNSSLKDRFGSGPSAIQKTVASSSSGFRLASRSILSTLKGMSCCSAQDVQGCENRIDLSQRMKDLAEQLQKSKEEVRKAVKTEALVKTVRNTEKSQSEATNIPQTTAFP
ncbi:hypothetical protein FCM35_KLT00707 [Carex littledalei]|uniref:Uncharacterized protein n=1 Tax=Carex littledalei TaxID=544730 RepID=A0A833RJ01_9POAL|nr:hypothetical protein FCM35_KLT00707 [Carex littledalei]